MEYRVQFCFPRCSFFFTILLVTSIFVTPTCSIPITSRVSETCTSNNECISIAEYCADDSRCTAVQYNPIISTNSTAASSSTTAFNLIMVTDPQFYFKICKKQKLTECIYYNEIRRPAHKRKLLINAAKRQVDCIEALTSSLPDVKAVFDNGDLVNKAKSSEIRDLDKRFHNLINLPLVVGLGNHDYGIDDYSKGYSPEGRKAMVNYLANAIIELNGIFRIRNIDFNRSGTITNAISGNEEVYNTGSFCYSVDFNDYVFIMLHWSTALVTGPYKTTFQAEDTSGATTKTEYFEVSSPETWLKTELHDIRIKGKKAILVPHSYKGLLKFTKNVTGMSNFLRDSSVIAVLSGHVHDAWGLDQLMMVGDSMARTIPVYYAGSTSYQKLIVMEMEAAKAGMKVVAYDTAGGASCQITTNADSAN